MPFETVLGVVMAGGASRRMGFDKRGLRLDGRSLVDRAARALRAECDQVAISLQPDATWGSGEFREIHDRQARQGPLAGLEAALREAGSTASDDSETRAVFLLACDLPNVGAEVVRHLLAAGRRVPEAAAVVPVFEGRRQPLCALYRANSLAAVRGQLESEDRSMAALLAAIRVVEVELGPELPFYRPDLFQNLNRPLDLDRVAGVSAVDAGSADSAGSAGN